jgi:hypothetical protein
MEPNLDLSVPDPTRVKPEPDLPVPDPTTVRPAPDLPSSTRPPIGLSRLSLSLM